MKTNTRAAKRQTGNTPAPDRQAIHDALVAFTGGDGLVTLNSIPIDGGGADGRTFTLPDELGDAVEWAAAKNATRQVYFSVARPAKPKNKKLAKGDIGSCEWVWVDIDPDLDTHGGFDKARAHLMNGVLTGLREAKPTIIADSGNGLQAFWRLRDGVIERTTAESIEKQNKALIAEFDGDPGTFNADRIMRLPGTINWPTRKKVVSGYPDRPALANILLHEPKHRASPGLGQRDEWKARSVRIDEEAKSRQAGDVFKPGTGADPFTAIANRQAQGRKASGPWAKLNDLALANIAQWAPSLFPVGKFYDGTSAWRVKPADYGYPECEEDLSIHPSGIRLYGPETTASPLDLVGMYLHRDPQTNAACEPPLGAVDAARWLVQRLEVDPAELGFNFTVGVPEDAADPRPDIEPFDFSSERKAPQLPEGVLPPKLDAAVQAVCRAYGASPIAYGVTMLTVAAGCINGLVRISNNRATRRRFNSAVRPSMASKLIGLASTGKTPTSLTVLEPVREIDKQLTERFKREFTAYMALEAKERKEKPEPLRVQSLVENTTVARLARDKAKNVQRGIVWYHDEWSETLGRFSKHSGGEASNAGSTEDMLQFWNGNEYKVTRQGDGRDTPNNTMILPYWGGADIGNITPVKLKAPALADAHEDGLLARQFLVLMQPHLRIEKDDTPLDSKHLELWAQIVRLLWCAPRTLHLIPSDEAFDVFEEYVEKSRARADLLGDTFFGLASWLQKMEIHLARIALVVTMLDKAEAMAGEVKPVSFNGILLDEPTGTDRWGADAQGVVEVSADAMRRAVQMAEVLFAHAYTAHESVFGVAGPYALVRRIADLILALHVEGALEDGNTVVSRALLASRDKRGYMVADDRLRALVARHLYET